MFVDIPPDLPAPIEAPARIVNACVNHAARHFRIHPAVIHAIIDVEGGKIGTMSKNTNGTYDMGIMQINTIHLPDIYAAYPTVSSWEHVAYQPCTNIAIGTWILSKKIKGAPDLWTGVGHYHSKTKKYKKAYLKKIYKAYKRIIGG